MSIAKERDLMSWRDFGYEVKDVTVKAINDGLVLTEKDVEVQVLGVDQVAEMVVSNFEEGENIKTADLVECAKNLGFKRNVADKVRKKLLAESVLSPAGKGRYIRTSSLPSTNSRETKQT